MLNLQKYELETGCFRLATIMHEYLHGKRSRTFYNFILNEYSFSIHEQLLDSITCKVLMIVMST